MENLEAAKTARAWRSSERALVLHQPSVGSFGPDLIKTVAEETPGPSRPGEGVR